MLGENSVKYVSYPNKDNKMKEKLIIIGAGAMAPEVVDFVQRYNLYEIVGFSVDEKYITDTYLGYPVYPTEHLEDYVDKSSVKLFIAISWYNKFNRIKKEKFENLKQRGFSFANLISPHAIVYPTDLGGVIGFMILPILNMVVLLVITILY